VDRVYLREFEKTSGIRLNASDRDLLRRLAPSVTVEPSIGAEGVYDLTPGSCIGSINLGSTSVIIIPKVPISRVLFLILYSIGDEGWRNEDFDFAEEFDIIEALAIAFSCRLKRLVSRGLLRGYRSEQTALPTVRGRILFQQQVLKRYGASLPIELLFDEHTADIEENRILRAAIQALRRGNIRSTEVSMVLQRLDHNFDGVSCVNYSVNAIPKINYTRLNEHYRSAAELARRILENRSISLHHGIQSGSAFLVDMNCIFEDFLFVALKNSAAFSSLELIQGSKGHKLKLDEEGNYTLQPDISSWAGDFCHFAADVKYKDIDSKKQPNADIYQMLAYCTATQLQSGFLIYAGSRTNESVTIRNCGRKIRITSIDLKSPPSGILSQVNKIAEHMRMFDENRT
jgi:5-methylcytosine-specific restriction enzyme subunit McrC